ncbi:protein farnesyltransferase subunit beta-like isoform X2 [Lycium barbarum]|uniref:protein farnesyltransferase subunit beta-like isoform X2 n=1 Tax=Lycium barbarum TaxID=112863 RepID=UPI00293E6D5D|nr:protein farnesyltransferase subunit beta-like isoform X2 [Lycium barbarum]
MFPRPIDFCITGGATFCAVASLRLMGLIEDDILSKNVSSCFRNVPLLLDWSLKRQATTDGGFQGRLNKATDTCYAFWYVLAIILDFTCLLAKINKQSSECFPTKVFISMAGSSGAFLEAYIRHGHPSEHFAEILPLILFKGNVSIVFNREPI